MKIIIFLLLVSQCFAGTNKYPDLVTPEIDAQIEKSLKYLAEQQDIDGKWEVSTEGKGFTTAKWTMASTSMVGLAFLAHGDTPTTGVYSKNVNKAVHWILNRYDEKLGRITTDNDAERPMYGHCFAVLFLSEVYGMEGNVYLSDKIRWVLEKSVRTIERAQTKDGGWYYGWEVMSAAIYSPDSEGNKTIEQDEGSVTIHAIQALRAAKNAGITVNVATIEKGLNYIVKCQNTDGGIRYQLHNAGNSEPAISAAAVATFYMAGVYQLKDQEYKDSKDAKAKAVKRCWYYSENVYKKGMLFAEINAYPFYAHLYMAQASWITNDGHFELYYPNLSNWLLTNIEVKHDKLPIWKGDQAGANFYYSTAAALIILQIPKQYLPILTR